MWVGGERIMDPTQQFEKGRIRTLQEERIRVQQKTFTKWINFHLRPTGMEVKDLFDDIRNGRMLHQLLEIISGERLQRISRGIMRIQQLENVGICLTFLSKKVYLENIGPGDIVDGNKRLILGLIWTIILRFQIQQIVFEEQPEVEQESAVKRSAKESLLLWCQKQVEPYPDVKITNFDKSWQDGMAFNALLHSRRPDLVNYEALSPVNAEANLRHAFEVAERELNIPKLLDTEDLLRHPEEKSVMTYVAQIYSTFAKMKAEARSGRRMENVFRMLKNIDDSEKRYLQLSSDLLVWVRAKTKELNNHAFPNSLPGIQKHLDNFNTYRKEEKPEKYKEKGELHMMFHSINVKCFANNRIPFYPPEGRLIKNIEAEWDVLDKAERDREKAIVKQYLKLESLERVAERFKRKEKLRLAWLEDMWEILEDQEACRDELSVLAAFQRNEAILLDVQAREEKFNKAKDLAKFLWNNDYINKDDVSRREKRLRGEYQRLCERVKAAHVVLQGAKDAGVLARQTQSIRHEIKALEPSLLSQDYGSHLLMVEDLLRRHSMLEGQIVSLEARITKMDSQVNNVLLAKHPDSDSTLKAYKSLKSDFKFVKEKANARRKRLNSNLELFQFHQEADEEEMWLDEQMRILANPVVARDLISVIDLQKKQKNLEQNIDEHSVLIEQILSRANELLDNPNNFGVEVRMESLPQKLMELKNLSADRHERLQEALETQQYYADANDAESWMNEKYPLVSSDDYGSDAVSAVNLFEAHKKLMEGICTFEDDIKRLRTDADRLKRTELALQPSTGTGAIEAGVMDEFLEEEVYLPVEVEDREMISREVDQVDTEMREIPIVLALRDYKDKKSGQFIKSGDQFDLLDSTDDLFWVVKNNQTGLELALPQKLLKPNGNRTEEVHVSKVHTVHEEVAVKRIQKRKQKIKRRKTLKYGTSPSFGENVKNSSRFDSENIQLRQQTIESTYKQLSSLSSARLKMLQDFVKLFNFAQEGEEIVSWIDTKDKWIRAEMAQKRDSPDSLRQVLETFLTEMVANEGRVSRINKEGQEVMLGSVGQNNKKWVSALLTKLNSKWEAFKKLKAEKEKILAGAAGMHAFETDMDGALEIAREHISQLEAAISLSNDPNSGSHLLMRKRSCEEISAEINRLKNNIRPLGERLNKLIVLGNSLAQTNPREAAHIKKRVNELQVTKDHLQALLNERVRQLEQEKRMCQFKKDSEAQINWAQKAREMMAQKQQPADLETVSEEILQHNALKDEIDLHIPVMENLIQESEALASMQNNDKDFALLQHQIKRLPPSLTRESAQREKFLNDCKSAAQFYRDADGVTAKLNAQLSLLDTKNLGSSVDEVEALQRSLSDQLEKMALLDEKATNLNKKAANMSRDRNVANEKVNHKIKELNFLREKVWELLKYREKTLEDSFDFQTLLRDAAEIDDWMVEKLESTQDPQFREMTNIDKKQKKISALESELETRYADLNKIAERGKQLMNKEHYASPEIKQTLLGLAKRWKELKKAVEAAAGTIGFSHQQKILNDDIKNRKERLCELEDIITAENLGNNLNEANDLFKEAEEVEEEVIKAEKDATGKLSKAADGLIKKGHFDPDGVKLIVSNYAEAVNQLQDQVKSKKSKLNDSVEFFTWKEDALAQKEWFEERIDEAGSAQYGFTLDATSNLLSRHQALDQELSDREKSVEDLLLRAQKMIEAGHYAKDQIESIGGELTELWNSINADSSKRMQTLESYLKFHRLVISLEDALEWVEAKRTAARWRVEKISCHPDKLEERKIANSLTNHKTDENAVSRYLTSLNDVDNACNDYISAELPMNEVIANKQSELGDSLDQLSEEMKMACQYFETCQMAVEFQVESTEMCDWFVDAAHKAQSDDFGKDYESFQLVQTDFEKLKESVLNHKANQLRNCENLNHRILKSWDGDEFNWVSEKLEDLLSMMHDLESFVSDRDELLTSAGELHKYNREVFEALSLVQEKQLALPSTTARLSTLQGVQKLLRDHENFETGIVALEAQLHDLVEEADRLSQVYPGENEESLAESKNMLIESWQSLKGETSKRRKNLLLNLEFQKYKTAVKDLNDWIDEQLRLLSAIEESATTFESVKMAEANLNDMKNALKSKEDDFKTLVDRSDRMITGEDTHPNAEEIDNLLSTVLGNKANFEKKMASLGNDLKEQSQFYGFLSKYNNMRQMMNNELKQLDSSNARKVSHLAHRQSSREQEALENKISKEEKLLEEIQNLAHELAMGEHPRMVEIEECVHELGNMRQKLLAKCKSRRAMLEATLAYLDFNVRTAEEETWLKEKQLLADNDDYKKADTFEMKIKVLQKHQALESEIELGKERYAGLKKDAVAKIYPGPFGREAKATVTKLDVYWQKLLESLNKKNSVLAEARDVVTFFKQCDSGDQWLKEKESLVKMGDYGTDYEQCKQILDKLNKKSPDEITPEKLNKLNALADSLIRKGQLDPKSVQERRDEINQRHHHLTREMDDYGKGLEKALLVHKFIRDCGDLNDMIQERAAVAKSEDIGDGLEYAQSLAKRHELVEKNSIPQLQAKLVEIKSEGKSLATKQPEKTPEIKAALQEVESNWLALSDVMTHRRSILDNAVNIYTFLHACSLKSKWAGEIIDQMKTQMPAKTVKEASRNLQDHRTLQKEIQLSFKDSEMLIEQGNRLRKQDSSKAPIVQEAITKVENDLHQVQKAWDSADHILHSDLTLQEFLKEAARFELELSNKELIFASSEIGDSLSAVDSLFVKYNGHVTSFKDIEKGVKQCITAGNSLLENKHPSSDKISRRISELQEKVKFVNAKCDQRKAKLYAAHEVQLFLQKARKFILWTADQDKKALDESYKDSTNLLHKIEGHSNFEALLKSQGEQAKDLESKGANILHDYFSSAKKVLFTEDILKAELESKIKELSEEWDLLVSHSAEKKKRLREALQAVEFDRTAEKLEHFAEEREKEFESNDFGESLSGVKNLMKKYEKTKEDLFQEAETVESLQDTIESFKLSEHFLVNSMENRLKAIVARYDLLSRASKQREDNLNSSFLVYTFIDKVRIHSDWVQQKLAETDFTFDWTSRNTSRSIVESMLSASEALDQDIADKTEVAHTLEIESKNLIVRHPVYKNVITKTANNYQQLYKKLEDASKQRTKVLVIILQALKVLIRMHETENWLMEKKKYLVESETKLRLRDEDSCQNVLNKVCQVESDLKDQKGKMSQLEEEVNGLAQEEDLPQREFLATKFEDLSETLEEVSNLCNKRSAVLRIQLKMFQFEVEVDQMLVDLEAAKVSARNDDYGHDVESVELLISDFIGRDKEVKALEERCDALLENGSHLASSPVALPYLSDKISSLKSSKRELDALRDARSAALDGARLVHRFDRDVEDCRATIQDKQIELSSEHDLDEFESLQLLYEKQSDVEKEIAGVEKRVEKLENDGKNLVDKYGNESHVTGKLDALKDDWRKLVALSSLQNNKLSRLESIKQFYDAYREIMGWINETITCMNSEDMPRDVPGAQLKLKQHEQLKVTIAAKENSVKHLWAKGQQLIESGVSVQEDIHEKRCRVQDGYKTVETTWHQRNDLFIINLDLQKFLADVENLDSWIQKKTPQVTSKTCGDNLIEVEDLLKKQGELEQLIEDQKEKMETVLRKTKLESGLSEWKEREEERLRDEQRRKLQASIRKRETTRLTDERHKRNREQRRRTQEINLSPEKVLPLRTHSAHDPSTGSNLGVLSDLTPPGSSHTPEKKVISPFFTDYESPEARDAQQPSSERTLSPTNSISIPVPKAPIIKQTGMLNRPNRISDVTLGAKSGDSSANQEQRPMSPVHLASPSRKISTPHQITSAEGKEAQARMEEKQMEMRRTFGTHRKKNIESALQDQDEDSTSQQHQDQGMHHYAKRQSSNNSFDSPSQQQRDIYPQARGSFQPPSADDTLGVNRVMSGREPSRSSLDDPNSAPSSTYFPAWTGQLERKHVLQSGGRKAAVRHWKSFYATVMAHTVQFFKDEHAYATMEPAASFLKLDSSICEEASDYHKRKNTVRLLLRDGSEYLLSCKTPNAALQLLNALNEEANKASVSRSSSHRSQTTSSSNQPTRPPLPHSGAYPPSNLGIEGSLDRSGLSLSASQMHLATNTSGHPVNNQLNQRTRIAMGKNAVSSAQDDNPMDSNYKFKSSSSSLFDPVTQRSGAISQGPEPTSQRLNSRGLPAPPLPPKQFQTADFSSNTKEDDGNGTNRFKANCSKPLDQQSKRMGISSSSISSRLDSSEIGLGDNERRQGSYSQKHQSVNSFRNSYSYGYSDQELTFESYKEESTTRGVNKYRSSTSRREKLFEHNNQHLSDDNNVHVQQTNPLYSDDYRPHSSLPRTYPNGRLGLGQRPISSSEFSSPDYSVNSPNRYSSNNQSLFPSAAPGTSQRGQLQRGGPAASAPPPGQNMGRPAPDRYSRPYQSNAPPPPPGSYTGRSSQNQRPPRPETEV